VASSRGVYVCLTDDDCEASPAWAERLIRAIESGADAVAGRTVTAGPGRLGAAADLIAGAPALVGPAGQLVFVPSNNVACRAQLLVDIPFDERFPVAAGEDRDWCRRILHAGCVLRHEPAAVLFHRPESTLRAFLGQQVRYGRGAFWYRRHGPEPQPLEPVRFYCALLGRSFRDGLLTGMLVTVAQAATALGFFLAWAGDRDR
jgi:GT2 family glycosyltransferase